MSRAVWYEVLNVQRFPSGSGQSRRFGHVSTMSKLAPTADVRRAIAIFAFGPIRDSCTAQNRVKKTCTQIYGIHVRLEELFTASQADIRWHFANEHCSGAGLHRASFTFRILPLTVGLLVLSRNLNIRCFDQDAPSIDFVLHVF
jgi:hypothetical protein